MLQIIFQKFCRVVFNGNTFCECGGTCNSIKDINQTEKIKYL